METLAEVKNIEYIPRDKALEIFKERHKNDSAISQSLEELQDNPLLASLNIKAYNPKEYAIIAGHLDEASFKGWFEKVTYAQNAVVIERLGRIIDTAQKGGLILIVFIALIAVLVTFNTIRLAIYSNREEIGIMRLVGASNSFIRGPYVVEGIIYGMIAGIVSIVIAGPVIYFASPYIKIFIPEINLWSYFGSHLLRFLGLSIAFRHRSGDYFFKHCDKQISSKFRLCGLLSPSFLSLYFLIVPRFAKSDQWQYFFPNIGPK